MVACLLVVNGIELVWSRFCFDGVELVLSQFCFDGSESWWRNQDELAEIIEKQLKNAHAMRYRATKKAKFTVEQIVDSFTRTLLRSAATAHPALAPRESQRLSPNGRGIRI